MSEMTREEFYEKYGDVPVKFSDYYKYTFFYEATLNNGDRLRVGYGGDSRQIYRHDVDRDSLTFVSVLQPYSGEVRRGKETIAHFMTTSTDTGMAPWIFPAHGSTSLPQ